MSIADSNLLPELEKMHLSDEEFKRLDQENQLKYLALLKREAEFRKQLKASTSYLPNPKQESFHLSEAPVRAIFGGNRSGKTTAGGLEFIWHITGKYPEWYPAKLRYDRPVKGRIIASDYSKGVGEVIIPFFEEWLDESMVERKLRNPLNIHVKWIFKNGSVFDILTHEQNDKSFEGWKGDLAWFDEPPPRSKYVATMRGLVDNGGRCMMTLTPLKAPWIYDEVFKKHDGKNVFVVTMDIRDNLKRVEGGRVIGKLTEENIAKFEGTLNKDEKLARLQGAFMHLTGRVYKQFDPTFHVIKPVKIQPHWVRYMCIDPHPRKDTAVVWLAVDEHDNHYLYDELTFGGDAEQLANMIHAQEGLLVPHQRYIDPAMDKDNKLFGGMNVRKELAKYGVYCQRANNDFDLGYNRICEALRKVWSPIFKTNTSRLKIFDNCDRTVYEFEHYMWADYKRNPEEHDPKESVNKKDDDHMDCLRYIYNAGPRFYEVESNQDEEEIVYTGTYTKHPTKQTAPANYSNKPSYNDLVDRREE